MNKFGSIAWQDELIKNIKEKQANNEEFSPTESAFVDTQAKHNSDILEGY